MYAIEFVDTTTRLMTIALVGEGTRVIPHRHTIAVEHGDGSHLHISRSAVVQLSQN